MIIKLNEFINILVEIYDIKDSELKNKFYSFLNKFKDIEINKDLYEHINKLIQIDKKYKIYLDKILNDKTKDKFLKLIDEFNRLQILILIYNSFFYYDDYNALIKLKDSFIKKYEFLYNICKNKLDSLGGGYNKYKLIKIIPPL